MQVQKLEDELEVKILTSTKPIILTDGKIVQAKRITEELDADVSIEGLLVNSN